jgi:predicted TIM-barrel fold metal-dependent hydrolase
VKPIIDVHEHIFSARDIPVKGYLYSRKYTTFVKFIGRTLHFFSLLAWVIRRKTHRRRKDLLYTFLVGLAGLAMGVNLRRWADILSLGSVVKINRLMLEIFQGNDTALYTPLMLDYEYWFRNSIDHTIYFQVKKISDDIIPQARGRIHPFIAYDPARDLAFRNHVRGPDGKYERRSALELVKDAIANRGFIGVKLYHSLGYRPVGNRLVDNERRHIFRRNKLPQYQVFSGDEIDAVLDELYRYCLAEEVPITVHCLADGIEAYYKASYAFGKPEFWKEALDRYPKLHVNLAHFGWNLNERYNGPGYQGGRPWMNVICDMTEQYEFLYTDTGCHDVLTPKIRREFITDYLAISRDYPGLLARKLLFGIDWHVIAMTNHYPDFLPRYVEVLRDQVGFTAPEIEDILGGNALRFLGLMPLGTPPAAGWSKNRARLAAYYAARGITPPDWFTSTN